jgi:cytochrome c-type biogenesis protein
VTQFLDTLALLITDNFWLAPLLALLAGVVTAFTPCCLSSVPLIIGYVGGTSDRSVKKSFKLSLVFSLGMVLTSTILGLVIGKFSTMVQMYYSGGWWYVVLGILMLLMALQVWEVVTIIPSTYLTSRSKKKGNLGAFLAGVLAGVFSSPCSTPILVALLLIVAQQGNMLWGGFLLLLYSIGHSVLFLVAGTFTGSMRNIMASGKYGILSQVAKWGSGTVILILGFYLLYLGL